MCVILGLWWASCVASGIAGWLRSAYLCCSLEYLLQISHLGMHASQGGIGGYVFFLSEVIIEGVGIINLYAVFCLL